uniref:Synaptobrevin, longin-like domain protein n=1 Tax=Tanacetum cinerariifolium TaxID=118510 RepID=A0A699ISB0_TANCI|nr:hypothetical protein [Tanacetum cinerariifolium]
MVAILEKSEHNVDFHPMVDFVEASPLRYALTFKPTVYVSHIRQFWSIARIETTEEGTKILATIDGIRRTVTESSLRRNLKLQDEEGISYLPDTELFENLTLMGYNISQNQKFTFQKGFNEFSSNISTALVCLATNRTYNFSKMIFDGLVKNVNNKDKANIAKTSTLPHDSAPRVTSPIAAVDGSMLQTIDELTAFCTSLQRQHSELISKFEAHELEINRLKVRVKLLEDREGLVGERFGDDAPIKGRNLDEGEAAAERVSDDTEEMATVLTSMDAATVLASGVAECTASPVFTTTTVVTPYRRRKGKEVMVKSETPKKQKVQEQIDAQVAKELEEQLEREDQRMSEQIARDAEVARIYVEEELQSMIDGLDRSNEIVKDFIPMGSKEEAERFKRKRKIFEQESAKKLKTSEEVPEEVKSPDEIHEEKHLDREDLNQLWSLVNEFLSNRPPTSDKEIELWVELKRLYEPDDEDQLWTHTQNQMHASVEWKLYDMCGVHQVTSKDKEIFMLVEKEYPLRKGLAIVMISYTLQVENYSRMANDLILKIYKITSTLSQQGIPTASCRVPTASCRVPTARRKFPLQEESCHYLKKRDATAKRIALLGKCLMITPRF